MVDKPDRCVLDLLAEHAKILNEYGVDSPAELEFLGNHAQVEEFARLASIARKLKREFRSTQPK